MERTKQIQIFANTDPKARRYRFLSGAMFCLEGTIGASKSTTGESLEYRLNKLGINAKYFPEYKNNEYLGLYLKPSDDEEDPNKNMKNRAFGFQMVMLIKRFQIYREAWEFAKKGGTSIIDRSLPGDYTFAFMLMKAGFITEEEWEVYMKTLTTEVKDCPEPTFTIYLDVTPENAYERMKLRGNQSEIDGYTIEYFQDLEKTYKKTMKQVKQPIIYFDRNPKLELTPEGRMPNSLCDDLLDAVIDKLYFEGTTKLNKKTDAKKNGY